MRKYIFLLVMFVLTFCSCGEKGTTYSETDFNGEGVFGALPQMSARMSSIVKPAMDKMNEKYPKLASDDPKDKEEVVKGQEFNDYLNSILSCYVEIAVPYKTQISVLKDPDGATQKNIGFCKRWIRLQELKS